LTSIRNGLKAFVFNKCNRTKKRTIYSMVLNETDYRSLFYVVA